MTGRGWFSTVGGTRVALEVGLLSFALVLPLAAVLRPAIAPDLTLAGGVDLERRIPALSIGLVYAGYISALLGAVRLRRQGGGVWRSLRHELAGAVAVGLAIWVGALLAHVVGSAWVMVSGPAGRWEELSFALRSPAFALSSAVSAALVYPLFRGVVVAWPAWDRLRRSRLLWALTHAQLIGSLALAAVVAVFSTASMGADRLGSPLVPEFLPDDAAVAAVLLGWLEVRILPALTEMLVLGVAAAAILLPLAALISYLALRRTTRRLEELAAAAGALRAGDLSIRVPVGGEDEVGRLQSDFNAMAVELERTLRELQAERDRVSGLLESRRQLVASVSHELRTPVATLRGYLESALRRDLAESARTSPDPGPHEADLETMAREVARLQRLIDDLFTLSRTEVGRLELRPEPADLGAIVRRMVDSSAPLAWKQHRVQLLGEVAADLPPALVDVERTEQILGNLLGNAVRHTPPGGLVAAVVSAEPNVLRLEVRDTGEGILPEVLPRIFERFYRGAGVGGGARDGAGLGLALVKELAEAMGGSVDVASTPGEGSCFTVRLPRA